MRKEASINAWKQLYDITLKLDKLEPWNDLGDTQLVTIQLKDREEPVSYTHLDVYKRQGSDNGIKKEAERTFLTSFV